MRHSEFTRSSFSFWKFKRTTCWVGTSLLCQFALLGGLVAPILGQQTIPINTTQTGGTETVTGNSGAFEGFLFITDPTNDPTLTLDSNATLNSRGLVIGSLENETGNLLIQGGSSLINTTSTPGGSGGIVPGGGGQNQDIFTGQARLGLYADSAGTATVTGAGSQWQNSSALAVGVSGQGTLSINGGGSVTNTVGTIGQNSGSNGTVTVNGGSSQWLNSSALAVGVSGQGTLSINGGGSVTNTVGTIGQNSGSNGTVSVNGGSSQWLNSNALNVGNLGTGELSIENDGLVTSNWGYLGNNNSGFGTVTVTGAGSKWQSSNQIFVGRAGTGTMSIEDGGLVTNNSWAAVGLDSGSSGNVTVTGVGSHWQNAGTQSSGALSVGHSGTGMMSIENGGVVSNTDGRVGLKSGSIGVVTVTGAGSKWQNSSSLSIGYDGVGVTSGTGTVTVANGGLISVGSFLNVGTSGTLNVNNGGTLSLATNSWIRNDGVISGQINANGRRITGTGIFSDLNVGDGAIVSPGNSPGSLITSNTQWGDNGTYEWELAELGGEAGMDWDLWNANNLDILSDGAFTIQIRPIDDMSNLTALADWDPTQNYSWLIATSTNAGFTDASLLNLVLDYSNFETFHDLAGGSFNLKFMDGNNSLYLDFNTSGVPEPTTLMMFGTGLIGLICPRRRKRSCLES